MGWDGNIKYQITVLHTVYINIYILYIYTRPVATVAVPYRTVPYRYPPGLLVSTNIFSIIFTGTWY
jgi:hypothetical protein